jgi:tetratricopeptide (TPR) repeat protein
MTGGADDSAREILRQSVLTQIELGRQHEQGDDWTAALVHYRQAAELDPKYAPIYLLIGNALAKLGDWTSVIENYENAIRHLPKYADAWNNLGIALQEMMQEQDAVVAYSKAIEINPHHVNAWFNLGKLSAKANEVDVANTFLRTALAIEPRHAYAWHELGSLQEKNGLLAEAAASYTRSVELDPTLTVRENLAAVLTLLGDARGLEQLRQLVREQPLNAESHWNLAMGLLLHSEYAAGWKEYEWRMEIPRFHTHHHRFSQPRWQGEALDGRTILLYGEQGHGDTLQFLRYVPIVVARGGRVILEVLPLLKGLLQELPGIEACLSPDDPKPEFSVHASLMSLPHLLSIDSIPAPVAPVLKTPRDGAALSARELRVGIAWAGNPNQKRDHLRSIQLDQWKPVAEVGGVAFTSLQMGPSRFSGDNSGSPFSFVEDCGSLQDFAELAAVVAQLDVVISIDSAVAHLAGIMGKPVWILLPNAIDWRWGLRKTTTPWYPNARLFRQTTPNNWSAVMAEVSGALRALAASSRRQ